MASVDELDFLIETAKIEHELVDAKEAALIAGPLDEDAQARARAAKDAARAHRRYWREIREVLGTAVNDGDAAATPDTHGMGIAPQEG